MFAVLNLVEPCPSFLARRAQKKYIKRCEPERVKPEGCLPFFIMPVYNDKRGIEWQPVRDKLGKCAARVIAPRDIALPDGLGFQRYVPRRLVPSLVFNTALFAVAACGKEIRRAGVTVTDRSALLTGNVCSLLPYVSRVKVITASPEKYALCAEKAMRDYGASLMVCDNSANLIEDDIIICADSLLPAVRAGAVFSRAKQARGCLNINGSGIDLGGSLSRSLPENVDTLDFAGALAELCGCTELLGKRFDRLSAGGAECEFSDLPARLSAAVLRPEGGNT